MRAWQVVGAGEPRAALALGEVALGPPPPGMLRVRVEACALGLPDVFMCRGSYALTPKTPFTPGQELAGVVLEAGPGAQARVGARVMAVSAFFLGHGGFAEEAWALDDFCFPVPDDMPVDGGGGVPDPLPHGVGGPRAARRAARGRDAARDWAARAAPARRRSSSAARSARACSRPRAATSARRSAARSARRSRSIPAPSSPKRCARPRRGRAPTSSTTPSAATRSRRRRAASRTRGGCC